MSVIWDDAKKLLLLTKTIEVLTFGEPYPAIWDLVAFLMGGKSKGFTGSNVKQCYDEELKNGEIIGTQFLSGQKLIDAKFAAGMIDADQKGMLERELEKERNLPDAEKGVRIRDVYVRGCKLLKREAAEAEEGAGQPTKKKMKTANTVHCNGEKAVAEMKGDGILEAPESSEAASCGEPDTGDSDDSVVVA